MTIQQPHHVGGGSLGRERSPPGHHLVARKAGLGCGRDVRRRALAARAADGERAKLAGLHQRSHGPEPDRHHLHTGFHEVGNRGSHALVRNVRRLDARELRENVPAEMVGRADAGGGVIEVGAVGLGVIDQFAQRVDRQARAHHQVLRCFGDQGDGSQVGCRIERERLVQERVDDDVARRNERERIAVCRRLGYELGARVSARARAVLDDDRLADAARKLGGQRPCHEVRGRAGRERTDEAQGPGRIGLRQSAGRDRPAQQRDERRIDLHELPCCSSFHSSPSARPPSFSARTPLKKTAISRVR